MAEVKNFDPTFFGTTLEEAKAWLRGKLDDGARCPCCTQMAKVYRRSLNAPMAAGLVMLYRMTAPEFGFLHITRLIKASTAFATGGRGDFAKLVYWGLVAEKERDEGEDKRTSGFWRITEEGQKFVRGETQVMEKAKVYDSRCLGFTGKPVTIFDCLKHRFSYEELMHGTNSLHPGPN